MGTINGQVYGITTGTVILTYNITAGGIDTETFTVNPAPPAAIVGALALCINTSATFSDATPGGTWSSSNTAVATVDPLTGYVYGVSMGNTYINYSVGGVCGSVSKLLPIRATTVASITGSTTICLGGTSPYTDDSISATYPSTWSSSNTSIVSIDATTGIATGIAVGNAIITYSLAGVCNTAYDTMYVNVINTSTAATITGTAPYLVGHTLSVSASIPGGTWSSSNTSVASVSGTTIRGVAAGTVVLSYSVPGCAGATTSTYSVTVTDIDGIAGTVHLAAAGYNGHMKVWLITYDASTSDLEAVDSTLLYCNDSNVYYEFLGVPTANYRIKAAVYDSMGTTTGYQPTYHTASFYWNTANIVNHTTGTADYNENINLSYGTVTTGPGFIGGNVTTGANKNTSGIPVAGLKMNVVNTATNALMQSIRTDAAGHYSFSNLPVGNYYVLPDSLNFVATNYTNIAITTAQPTVSAASFVQHTISKTITPVTEAVSNLNGNVTSVFAFPNPASSKLNLQWTLNAAETANVSVTDITGREMYTAAINMTQGTGVKQIDLSAFINGLYVISVKSATINYNSKIQVQH